MFDTDDTFGRGRFRPVSRVVPDVTPKTGSGGVDTIALRWHHAVRSHRWNWVQVERRARVGSFLTKVQISASNCKLLEAVRGCMRPDDRGIIVNNLLSNIRRSAKRKEIDSDFWKSVRAIGQGKVQITKIRTCEA